MSEDNFLPRTITAGLVTLSLLLLFSPIAANSVDAPKDTPETTAEIQLAPQPTAKAHQKGPKVERTDAPIMRFVIQGKHLDKIESNVRYLGGKVLKTDENAGYVRAEMSIWQARKIARDFTLILFLEG